MFCKKGFSRLFILSLICLILQFSLSSIYSSVQGADQIQKVQPNPRLVAYSQSPANNQAAPGAYRSDLRPLPLDLSYIESPPTEAEVQAAASYPAVFDLRTAGRVTSVMNQGNSNCSWAFAAYASLESALLPGETWDFSENNLKNNSGFDGTPNGSGNALTATAYLARWSGPVNEADDPFVDDNPSPPNLTVQKHIQEVHILPDRDRNKIKEYLQKYGAIYTTMYWGDFYFNGTHNSYYDWYTDYEAGNNQAVTIVGWNDNYSRNNFQYDTSHPKLPAGNGAYIVRNSKGADWGDHGYFYVSYYDENFARENFAFINAEPTANYQNIYQYDPLGWTSSIGYENSSTPTTAWMANVFTAAAEESLVAASWYTTGPNTAYQMYIYTNVTGGPTAGTPAATKTGTIAATGYHTIPFSAPVQLTAGMKFAVVVKLTTPNSKKPVAIETPVTIGDDTYYGNAAAGHGESFISLNGTDWTDLITVADCSNANACLKAFTAVPLTIINHPAGLAVKDGAKASFKVTASGTPPLTYQWKFNGQVIPKATTATLELAAVHPANAGNYTVTVTDSSGSLTSNAAVLAVPSVAPAGQIVETGTDCSFSVTATAGLPLTYQWKFNGQDLADGEEISGATTATLTIHNAQPDKAGIYSVIITNAGPGQNSSFSLTGKLTVEPRVSTPVFDPAGRIFTTARKVKVKCATPGAIIHYTTNGNDPKTSDPVVGSTGLVPVNKSLTLKAAAWKNGWISSQIMRADYTVNGTVATPVFSLKSGVYTSAQHITLTCATPGAGIRYTTDGSEPTLTNGTAYNAGDVIDIPTLDSTTTLKVKSWKDGWDVSTTATAKYTITGTLTISEFNPGPDGNLSGNVVSVAADCPSLSRAEIHYTTDGREPTIKSPKATDGQILVDRTMTLKAKAFAVNPNWIPSAVKSAKYVITQVAQPTFSLPAGTYDSPRTVKIGCATPGATIYYGLADLSKDSAVPDKKYTPGSAISISRSTTLTAKAVKAGMSDNEPVTVKYTIQETLPTPYFIPAPGSVSFPFDVEINCLAPGGAKIYYTTDENDPLENGTEYTGSIHLTGPTVLKAKAWLDGYNPSAVGSALYTCPLPTPKVNIDGGIYAEAQQVTISCTEPGTDIRYTTNGSEPTSKSALYTGPILINRSLTLMAKAWKKNWLPSDIMSTPYTVTTVATPTFSPNQEVYTSPRTVTISCATPGATIRYTLSENGIEPADPDPYNSKTYTKPFRIGKTTILKARAWKSNFNPSAVVQAEYTITGTVATPVVSLKSGGYSTSPQNVTVTCATLGATIRYTTDGKVPTETTGTQVTGGAIQVKGSCNLKFRAFLAGWIPSATVSRTYALPLSTLSFITSDAGTYEKIVTIDSSEPGAIIRYTTNGKEPTTKSTLYIGPILINKSMTLKAKTWKSGWLPSVTQTATYDFNGVATPIFNVKAGTYASTQKITISCPTKEADIYYTKDGNEPKNIIDDKNFLYKPGTVIFINSTTTLKAKAWFNDMASDTQSAKYTIGIVATPVLSLSPGIYPDAQIVTVSCSTANAVIHYTTNGKEPTQDDKVIVSGGSLQLPATVTLKFKAWMADSSLVPSATAGAVYTILQVAAPVFSPIGGTYEADQIITISCGTPGAIIRYTTNGNDPSLSDPVYGSGPPLTIGPDGITVKARAWKSGLIASEVVTADYNK